MNSRNFDDVFFVLSSDALAPLMLPELSDSKLRVVRDLARSGIERFMDGGTNYYMDASFSSVEWSVVPELFSSIEPLSAWDLRKV